MASPDIPVKNPNLHYMDKASGEAIEAWVKAGGVLILMQNDKTNSEFDSLQHDDGAVRSALQRRSPQYR